MLEVSSAAIDIITHGVARLEFKMNYLEGRPQPFSAGSLFSTRFWKSASKRELNDCSVFYELMRPGLLRILVCSADGYLDDSGANIDDINYDYFGDVQITEASALVLRHAAEVVLSLMKAWAKEQLELKAAA